MPYSLIVDDEWGVPYAAKTFETLQDIYDEIKALEDAMEEASNGRAYALQACIDQLWQIVHEAEEEPETLPDCPAF